MKQKKTKTKKNINHHTHTHTHTITGKTAEEKKKSIEKRIQTEMCSIVLVSFFHSGRDRQSNVLKEYIKKN